MSIHNKETIETLISLLKNQWAGERADDIVHLPAAKAIFGIGHPAINYILDDLKKGHSPLYVLLPHLTDAGMKDALDKLQASNPDVYVYTMDNHCNAWIMWGERNKTRKYVREYNDVTYIIHDELYEQIDAAETEEDLKKVKTTVDNLLDAYWSRYEDY